MPTFRIKDIFRISGRGYVLSGRVTEKGIILTGDKAVITEDHEGVVLKIIGASTEKVMAGPQ
jgi:translation elongation factor EF-Tu-like GTPase